ncbi:MAG TPA: TraB/GumN family protein [Saprospiraceae bacterium]|nr:TraB/GumN family protein [Saprospiraceae bacterium]
MIPNFIRKIPFYTFLLSSASLFFISCSGAQSAQKVGEPLPQSLLWKIESENMSEPSYLFGTIHMIPKEDYFLPTGLEEAFNKTENVVFEIDLDDMSGIGSLMGMLTNLLMKDGMTLSKLLTKEEYSEVADYFENMGLPMIMLNKVKPMFLSMLAEVNMDPAAMQSDDIVSYEMELYQKAQDLKKEVGGLETMKYQMSLFDSIPYQDQAKMLLDAVRGTNLESDLFDETIALYKTQNIEAMCEMVGQSESGENSNYEDVLLLNRNQNWIPVMAKMMTTGPVFFAVGAGHLGGASGVINLLKKQGYKLTPVSVYKKGPQKQRV